MCNDRQLLRSHRGLQRRNVELGADQLVKLSNRLDLRSFFVANIDGEQLFCAKNNLDCIKSHVSRLASRLQVPGTAQRKVAPLLVMSGWSTRDDVLAPHRAG